jgi:hypothetical protein
MMKKIIALVVAGLMASAAVADITGFRWGGGSASDGVTGSDYILTFTDEDATADISAFISGGEIDITDLNTLTVFNSQLATLVPVGPAAGQWGTATINSTDDSLAGDYVWAIVSDSSTLGGIEANDTFLLTQVAGPILAGTEPPSTASVFAPGSVSTITVVPEPATIGLFGLGALSAWIIRRNKAKATEEA